MFARMKKSYPTYIQSIILLVIWFLCTVVGVLAVMPFFTIENGIGLSIMYTLSMLLTLAAGFSIRGNWKFENTPFSMPVILICVFTILSLQIVIEPLSNLVPISQELVKILKGMKSQPYTFFLMAVVAAPLLEEVLFRGIILDGYLKNYKPLHGILISAFLFGLIHGNLIQGMGAFALGVLFGWIYWKTKSLVTCVVLHAINNLIAFVGALTTPEEYFDKSMRAWIDSDANYILLYGICIVVLGGSLWLLQKELSRSLTIESKEESIP
jgi:uncharacterized protein